MSIVADILANEQVFDLLSTVILMVVAGLLGKSTLLQRNQIQRDLAIKAVEAAVTDTYPLVKAYKEVNYNNKLSPEQRSEVQNYALSRAGEIAQTMGVDVAKAIGPVIARAVLEQAVSKLKGGKAEVKINPSILADFPDEPPSPKAI